MEDQFWAALVQCHVGTSFCHIGACNKYLYYFGGSLLSFDIVYLYNIPPNPILIINAPNVQNLIKKSLGFYL